MRIVKRAMLRVLAKFGHEVIRNPDGTYVILPATRLGLDPLNDIRQILGRPLTCAFDIGANVGETALQYAAAFRGAAIYSFEPDHETFKRLSGAVAHLSNVRLFNTAIGSRVGKATLFRNVYDGANSLLQTATNAEKYVFDAKYLEPIGTDSIDVMTLDDFCEQHHIKEIDLLKMDTQGYELEVLEGAKRTLGSIPVPLIYTEVNFVQYYESQPLFQDVYSYLYDLGYRLVGLYESGYLTHYYQVGGNALFVHERFGERKRIPSKIRIGPVSVHKWLH